MFRWILALALLLPSAALAEAPVVRVGTSGDYAPFSIREPSTGDLSGSDVELARAYARDRGLRLEWVPFRWPELLIALEQRRFDFALSGVTIRPERSVAGTFSVPVSESGAVLLLRQGAPDRLADLDQPQIRIGVNAGGHLERVTRARFPNAQVRAITPNAAVRAALVAGRVDAAVSDTHEAPHWLEGTKGLVALPPFTQDVKAALGHAGATDRLRDLDAWLLERRVGGDALFALVAAVDERLDLMPLVAEAKRGAGAGVRDRQREAEVLAAAQRASRAAAQAAGLAPPAPHAVAALFRAQFAAARQVQEATLLEPPPEKAPAPQELAGQLRPALLRIGDRIAWLLPRVHGSNDAGRVRELVERRLDTPGLSEQSRRSIAGALEALLASRS